MVTPGHLWYEPPNPTSRRRCQVHQKQHPQSRMIGHRQTRGGRRTGSTAVWGLGLTVLVGTSCTSGATSFAPVSSVVEFGASSLPGSVASAPIQQSIPILVPPVQQDATLVDVMLAMPAAPDSVSPNLALVPLLLPEEGQFSGLTPYLTELADGSVESPSFVQTWTSSTRGSFIVVSTHRALRHSATQQP
jgi:hypothetical protein